MADFIITDNLKKKIEDWFEDHLRSTPYDEGDSYKEAEEILFEFKYLKQNDRKKRQLNHR